MVSLPRSPQKIAGSEKLTCWTYGSARIFRADDAIFIGQHHYVLSVDHLPIASSPTIVGSPNSAESRCAVATLIEVAFAHLALRELRAEVARHQRFTINDPPLMYLLT